MQDEFHRAIANRLEELVDLASGVSAFLEANAAPMETAYTIELLMEEVLTNIVKYTYDDQRRHQIDVTLKLGQELATITIADDGHPFDPLTTADPDIDKPIAEREIGGLGLFLVRKMSNSAAYRREDGRNILDLTVKLRRSA